MKHSVTFFLLLVSLLLSAQNNTTLPKGKVAATQTNNPVTKKLGSSAQVQNLTPSAVHDTCLDKKFSLVIYLVQDSSAVHTGSAANNAITSTNVAAVTLTLVTPFINALNAEFSRMCVSFESCATYVIPNFNYREWDINVEADVISNWYTENTINVYFPSSISGPCLSDYAYRPDEVPLNSRRRNIVVSLGAVPSNPPANFIHAFGHLFGLRHTFDEKNPTLAVSPTPTNTSIISKEFVSRTAGNCALHGDGFCDTEADPAVAGKNVDPRRHKFCGYTGGEVDGYGEFYTPPFDNYMSFWSCRCRFSYQQCDFMRYTILTKRMYLH